MDPSYVLITPVRNEQATIEITIRSVLAQTVPPQEWVIVNDGSTDQTEGILKRFTERHPHIRAVHLAGRQEHSFASVVHATETGIRELRCRDYNYLGLLDADVRFPADYFQRLLAKFENNPRLGLAGGLVVDVGPGQRTKSHQNLNEVAGATQFFTRACFESLGGLLPIPEGGWDAITCVRARMNGFTTATFPDLVMDHLKPRNTAKGNWWRRNWQLGVRDYALGGHPAFEIAKCCSRALESPPLAASTARLCGYFQSALERKKRLIPEEVLSYVRREQLQRMGALIRGRRSG
jgi:glycosyltransferase involved in cell wall biosynthesis